METIKNITTLAAFEKVAKLQSYTKAAAELEVSKAYISKLIQGLEEQIGEKLFLRSTRKVRLTIIGEGLYRQCTGPLAEIENIQNGLVSTTKKPRGMFRVTVAGAFGEEFIAPVLLELTQKYKGLQVELLISTRKVDLIEENFDAAVRVGELEDSNLVARKIASRKEYICATPKYLHENGIPESPEELKDHSCLTGTTDTWTFVDRGKKKKLRLTGRFKSNNGRALLKGALSSSGLVKLPDVYVSKYIKSGKLISILEDYVSEEVPVWVVTHSKKSNSINLQAFWEVLEKKLK